MNTVKIGDEFEAKSYGLICSAIKNGDLGISELSARVYQKKGYYSKDRESDIIFDLSIEIWPPKAERYSLLFLIECKSSIRGNNVPVSDVEEFYTKMNQVAGSAVKGIMITNNEFQKGGLTFAKNKNLMLIEVKNEDNYNIILHRTEGVKENKDVEVEDSILNIVKKALGIEPVVGLKRLSKINIEEKALALLKEYNGGNKPLEINSFIDFVKNTYSINCDFDHQLKSINGRRILGSFNNLTNYIIIDKEIYNTNRFPFVFAHEFAHYFLHQELRINQDIYNNFEDSKYDFFADRYTLTNDRHWIEWQANKFAVGLLLPEKLFKAHLIAFRKSRGIRKPDFIYLDGQSVNLADYYQTIDYLSEIFRVSKESIQFRIKELNIIHDYRKDKRINKIMNDYTPYYF